MMGEVYMTLGLVCHREGGSQGIVGAGYAMLSSDGLACPFIGTLTLMTVLPQDPISVARKEAWVAANQDSCPVDLMVTAHNLRPKYKAIVSCYHQFRICDPQLCLAICDPQICLMVIAAVCWQANVYGPAAYDTVFAVAFALDKAAKGCHNSVDCINSVQFNRKTREMLFQSNFTGLTGPLTISQCAGANYESGSLDVATGAKCGDRVQNHRALQNWRVADRRDANPNWVTVCILQLGGAVPDIRLAGGVVS